jgi:hypothetical protein
MSKSLNRHFWEAKEFKEARERVQGGQGVKGER